MSRFADDDSVFDEGYDVFRRYWRWADFIRADPSLGIGQMWTFRAREILTPDDEG